MPCEDAPCCGCCDAVELDDREPFDGFQTDADADADVLASAGFGTDEDYGGTDEDFADEARMACEGFDEE